MAIADRRYGGRAVAERRAERRGRFVAVAIRVFAERGYVNCSLADLCAAAGLSKRQFYEVFDTREDVLIAAYDLVHDDAAAAVGRTLSRLDTDHDPIMAIAAVLTAWLSEICTDPHRAKLVFIEVVGVSERLERHRRERRVGWVRLLEMAVGPIAGPDARIRGSAALAGSILTGAVTGAAQEWLLRDARPPIEDLVDLLVPVARALIEPA